MEYGRQDRSEDKVIVIDEMDKGFQQINSEGEEEKDQGSMFDMNGDDT